MKHPFYCVMIVLCVSYAFSNYGVTSDSSASLGLDVGLGLYLDPSTNAGILGPVNDTMPWTKRGFISDGLESRPSVRSERNRRSASEVTDNVGLQNRSSELQELFAVGSGNESLTSTSKAKLVELEGGSSVKTDQIQTHVSGIYNLTLNDSIVARPTSSISVGVGLGLLPTSSNTASIVPSEGGLLQEGLGLSHSSTTESGSLEVNLPIGPSKIDVKGGNDTSPKVELELGLGIPTREGVSTIVNKQLESQDSHITARKGANLSEQTESVNDTMVPLTSTSSEIDPDSNLHTPKITPRKGAELPKIFPRKGVDEQFVNPNSSDLFSSDNNNNSSTRPTVSVVTSTTSNSSRPAGNPTDIVKHINTSKSGRPSLLNDSTIMKDMPEKSRPSTQSVISESSLTPTSRPAVTSKTDFTSVVAASSSNSTLNIKMPIIDKENITLDKPVVDGSGIIDSYPPLKKRPKPLKTTDLTSVSSSPITPEHSSSEHDYVTPIVVTILTVPMLVVLVLFLYKKGSEFWERRHYRRMDFLIDGMYND